MIIRGDFPDYILQQFDEMLDYFGPSPFIVRSSSLLEDNYGNSYAGKYDSVFCANQGPRERRRQDLLAAVKTIYASSMSERASTRPRSAPSRRSTASTRGASARSAASPTSSRRSAARPTRSRGSRAPPASRRATPPSTTRSRWPTWRSGAAPRRPPSTSSSAASTRPSRPSSTTGSAGADRGSETRRAAAGRAAPRRRAAPHSSMRLRPACFAR